jgi:hypothetical protein
MTLKSARKGRKQTSDEVKPGHSSRFPKVKKILQRVYYNPKKGYGGEQALYRQAQKHRITLAQVREWVIEQDTHTLHKPIKQKFKRHWSKVTDIDE